MIEVIEQPDRITVVSRTTVGMRVVFALLALFPLIAPYQLLIRIQWQTYLHPFFALAAIISAGAVALSIFFVFAALAALDSTTIFDADSSSMTYSAVAPIVKQSSATVPFEQLAELAAEKRDWSDGAPSYYLRIETSGAGVYEAASSWSRQEIEAIRSRISEFVAETRNAAS